MATNQVASLYWVTIARPVQFVRITAKTKPSLGRNCCEITMKSTALSFSLWNARRESPARGGPRHAFICGGRATTTCMNLPCLCFALICRVVARSGGDGNRWAEGNTPTCTCRPRPAGSGGVGVGATSSGRASTKLAEGDFGGPAAESDPRPSAARARQPPRTRRRPRPGRALHGLAWVAAAGFS